MINSEPLFNLGWIKFNCELWDLTSEIITLKPEKGNAWKLKTVIYRNRKGQIVNPIRTPYIPVVFECSTKAPTSYLRRKRAAIAKLAEIYSANACKGSILFSTQMDDPRPFTWEGFTVAPHFTFYLNIQNYKDDADKRVLKHSKKAESKGYYIERSLDFECVVSCLKASEERKGFSHVIDVRGLSMLNQLMTPDYFHCYLVKDKEGYAVGARVLLLAEEDKVLAWSAGINSSALRDGVNHFMVDKLLEFYANKGYKTFDFVGANIPAVAEMKEGWGGGLTTYYSVRAPSLRNQLISNYKYAAKLFKK